MSTRAQNNATTDTTPSSINVGGFAWSRVTSGGRYTQYINGVPAAHPTTTSNTSAGGILQLLADGAGGSLKPVAYTIQAAILGARFSDAEVLQIHNAVKEFRTTIGAPT